MNIDDPSKAEIEREVDLTVDEALTRERVRTVDACKAVVRRLFANEWKGIECLDALEKLK